MKKLLFAFWLTLQVGLNAYSQIWQSYKGIWLKGYDNATQAPIPPTGYSALTYFADSLGTYVYDWDSLAWLRIPGAGGGGGGGLVTADNGLSVNPAGNVRLGGTLTQSTTINGAGHTLTIGTGPSNFLSQFQVFTGTANVDRTGLTLNSSTANLTNVHNGTTGRVSGFFLNDNETFLRIDSGGVSATHEVNYWRDKVAFTIEGQRYAAIGAANTRFSPSSNFIVNAGSTVGNLSKATFTPTSVQLAVTDNFSYNNTITLSPTLFNVVTPTGTITNDPAGLIMSNGTTANSVQISQLGTQERILFQAPGSNPGSDLEFNLQNPNLADVFTTKDQIRVGTPNAKVTFDESDDAALFSADVVLQKVPTQLDTAVWFLARDFTTGEIVQRKVSGGGGGFTTADNGLIANTPTNVRLGTSNQPGQVLDEGAVFSTDSLNVGVSHFWFMPDSVQIGNLTDLGEGDEPAYVLIKDGTVSAHTATTELRLRKGGTNTMQVLFGGIPLYSFGSSLFRYGSSGLTPGTRLFEIANGSLLQFTSRIGDHMSFQTADGATGTESTGDILIRTGSVTSGTGAVGDIEIRLGAQAGGGSGGTLQLDPSNGFLTIVNIPTSDPCGSAPTGTVWSDSGTLKVCP